MYPLAFGYEDLFDVFKWVAAVSCSPDAYRFGGVGFGFWLTGKLGRAWHRCMDGAWVHGSLVVVWCVIVIWGIAQKIKIFNSTYSTYEKTLFVVLRHLIKRTWAMHLRHKSFHIITKHLTLKFVKSFNNS